MKRAAASVLLALACAEPTVPTRQAAYPFDDGFGEVFRWPADRLPVRYWADARGPMAAILTRALAVWRAQFLYQEFSAELVSDSATADVVVIWSGAVPADVPPDPGAPVGSCSGITTVTVDSTGTQLEEAIVVRAGNLAVSATDAQMIACYYRVVAHEVGHSLGLFQHSPQGQDLMAATPLVAEPAPRDRVTVEVLYHTTPTLAPPPR